MNKKKIIIIVSIVATLGLVYWYWKKKQEEKPEEKSDSDKTIQVAKTEQTQKVTVKPDLIADKAVTALDSLANPFYSYKEKDAYNAIMSLVLAMKNRADYNAVNTVFRDRRSGKLQTKRTFLNAISSDLPNYKSQFEAQWSRLGLVKDSGGVWSYVG
jgi:predicted negative regulator of RcsB-dependent stress response